VTESASIYRQTDGQTNHGIGIIYKIEHTYSRHRRQQTGTRAHGPGDETEEMVEGEFEWRVQKSVEAEVEEVEVELFAALLDVLLETLIQRPIELDIVV